MNSYGVEGPSQCGKRIFFRKFEERFFCKLFLLFSLLFILLVVCGLPRLVDYAREEKAQVVIITKITKRIHCDE